MPPDQALKEVRGLAGPSAGDGGSSLAWSARLEEAAAAIAPLLLIGGLALAGGGFGLSDRHIAGLVVWLLLAAMLVFGAASRATLGRPFYWASGLIGALALFSAFSSLWSGSIELSVIEADRVLVYLGFFLAAFLIAQTDKTRQRFGEGIALALIFVAALALASRLLPHLLSVAEGSGHWLPAQLPARLLERRRRRLRDRGRAGAVAESSLAQLRPALARGRLAARGPSRRSTSPTRAAACWRSRSPAGA